MSVPDDVRAELQSLLASARAHLEAEEELGAHGVPWQRPAASSAPKARALQSAPLAAPASRAGGSSVPQRMAAAAPEPVFPAKNLPILDAGERAARLHVLAEGAAACTSCVLHQGRTKSVFARGSITSPLVFVGEGPGRDEDLQGEPFVGRAGQLLDKMVTAMGFARDEVYICNVVKCRPPENRTPRPDEAIACRKFLQPQLEIIAPQVIVALGRCAAQALGVAEATGPWRGEWSAWEGVPVMPTYHPAFLLRSPEFKRTVWEDLQLVMHRLGKTPAKRT